MGGCKPDDFLRGSDRLDTLELDLDPAIDARYRLLGDRRRRALVYVLTASGQRSYSVPTLAARIAGLLAEESPSPSEVALELRHKHLPPFDALGLIECDERSGMLIYHGDERLETLLEPARADEVRED